MQNNGIGQALKARELLNLRQTSPSEQCIDALTKKARENRIRKLIKFGNVDGMKSQMNNN
jgi:hypothetical protein